MLKVITGRLALDPVFCIAVWDDCFWSRSFLRRIYWPTATGWISGEIFRYYDPYDDIGDSPTSFRQIEKCPE
ncbi:unnamed protein product [Gongylonema pulchrum]|uniref:Phage protein n=1 Tax=Gongylonema pulchrum TaxID=637853 RepID=A0A183D4G6_9BILA|nr:unnamed protein product [Gongylonema pulchrum]